MQTLAIRGGAPVRREPFTRWPIFDDAERTALSRVLQSGNWGGFPSPNVEATAFAREFAAYHGARHAVCAANGTLTLVLALRAGGVERGAEVIVPPLTFVATAAAPVYVGAIPVFADVRRADYTLDPDAVEAAITERTRAVICVHLGASVCDLDRLSEICHRRKLLLIEDCAHMHGAFWRDRGVGAWGDFGSFSFQSSKLMTAGEGGIVTTGDARYEKRLQSMVNCGRRDPGYEDADAWLGHNYRITEFQAAILRAQLGRLADQNARRAERFPKLAERLARIPGVSNLEVDSRVTRRAGYQFLFRFDRGAFAGKSKGAILAALRAEGIPAYEGYVPLNRAWGSGEFTWGEHLFAFQSFARHWYDAGVRLPDYAGVRCPVAEAAAEESIWLPHGIFLGPESDLDSVAEAVAKVQRHAAEL
jgi:dTDP-4-amino-4,6-dideoxygalactose transaminase